MDNTEYEIDLKEMFNMLKKRWIMIVATTLVAVIAAGVISFFVLEPVYQTSSTMLVTYKQDTTANNMTYNDIMASQKLVNTYSEIIKSRKISDAVIDQLDLELTAKELADKITVSPVKDTEIIRITVEDTDPVLAANIANMVVSVFKPEIKKIMNADNVSTIDIANVAEHPIKPNKLLNVAIAGVLGVMVSVGLVFFLEFLDRTFKTPTDIERHLGLPIIGAIPDLESVEKRSARSKKRR